MLLANREVTEHVEKHCKKKDLEEIFIILKNRKVEVDEVILLGDLKHEFGSILYEEWEEVLNLIDILLKKVKDIKIIKGNHDVIINPITKKKNIEALDYYIDGEVVFLHGDKDFKEIHDDKIKTWVIGHGHPAITLGDGIKKEKYKCFLDGFYKKKRIIVVPSFFPIIEGTDPRDYDLGFAWPFNLNKFKIKIIGDKGKIFDFGRAEDLSF